MMHVEAKGGRAVTTDAAALAATKARASAQATDQALDPAVVAAIAVALELESQPEASRIALARGPSFWLLAGRARVLRGR
jgi:hypothetical protein